MRETVKPEFVKGESLEWQKSFADYPASDGWALNYYFRGAGTGLRVEGTADGDSFLIFVSASSTAAFTAGTYYYQGFISLETEKILVDSGEVKVLPTLTDEYETFDGRSQYKIALDAIDALIAGKATLDQQEYTIGNRQLKRYPIPDLILLRDKYAALYASEIRAENRKKGKGIFKNSYVRFQKPR